MWRKIDIKYRKNKNQQGNENLVNQMQQEINEVNFLFWFYCIKVNVLMTFSRLKSVVKIMEQHKNDDKNQSRGMSVKGLQALLAVIF